MDRAEVSFRIEGNLSDERSFLRLKTRERIGDWKANFVHGKGSTLAVSWWDSEKWLILTPIRSSADAASQVTRAINSSKLKRTPVAYAYTLDKARSFAGPRTEPLKRGGCSVLLFAEPLCRSAAAPPMRTNTNGDLLAQFTPRGADFHGTMTVGFAK